MYLKEDIFSTNNNSLWILPLPIYVVKHSIFIEIHNKMINKLNDNVYSNITCPLVKSKFLKFE